MNPGNLSPYEKLAIKMFDLYSVRACSGFMYNCKVLVNCSPSDLDVKCITWVSMN